MGKKKNAKVESEVTLHTYAWLRTAALVCVERAKENEKGSFYLFMNALICSAFSLEAYFNHLGAQLFPYWSAIERSLSPQQKLIMICAVVRLTPDFAARPFQSVTTLFRFRNTMAHGKTETLHDTGMSPLNHTATGERKPIGRSSAMPAQSTRVSATPPR